MAAEAAERQLELLREEREAEVAESRYGRAGCGGKPYWLAPIEPAVPYSSPDAPILGRGLLSPVGNPEGSSPGTCCHLWEKLTDIPLRDLLSPIRNPADSLLQNLMSPVGSLLSPMGSAAVLTPV